MSSVGRSDLPSSAAKDPAGYLLGVDVGGTKVAVGILDISGHLLEWTSGPTPVGPTAEGISAEIADRLAGLLAAQRTVPAKVKAVGLAFPGDFGPDGRLRTIPNVPAFVGRDPIRLMRRALAERCALECPFAATNDACAAALAESRWGAGRGVRQLLYLTVSSGIGGALVVDGEARNLEPGLRLFPDPAQPGESLERLAGGVGLARQARRWLQQAAPHRAAALLQLAGVDTAAAVDARALAKAAEAGDRWAQRLLDSSANHVAAGIAQLLPPGGGIERVVVGGSLGLKAAGFFDRLRRSLGDALAAEVQELDVAESLRPAALGDERGVLGAALLTGYVREPG